MISERKENKRRFRFLFGESMGGAVVLLLHRKKPKYWDGAVLVAPMCKVPFLRLSSFYRFLYSSVLYLLSLFQLDFQFASFSFLFSVWIFFFRLQIADEMKPHPFVVKILKNLCSVIPTWKIVPTQDIIEVAMKNPELRKEVLIYLHLKKVHHLINFFSHGPWIVGFLDYDYDYTDFTDSFFYIYKKKGGYLSFSL